MQNKISRTWWKTKYVNYRDYLIESNPFNKESKARRAEWEAIYDGFDITPANFPKLIDFGCGAGHFTLNFLKKGFDVTGIDIESVALEILKKRAQKYNLSKKLHLVNNGLYAPIRELEGKFDAGYMIVTYHCISNDQVEQKKIFKNFVSLIRKGGKILIMEPNPLNLLFYFFYSLYYKGNKEEGYNIINSRKEILVSLLREAGMNDIKTFRHSFLPTSYINHWGFVREINSFLCSVPVVRNFAAFNIVTAVKNTK